MNRDLQGKVAVVTGSAVGVGRSTIIDFAELGCDVVVNYSRSKTEAEQTAASAEAKGVRALCIAADVRDDDAVTRLMTQARESLGRIDILVNNAGVTRFIEHGDLEAVTDDDWNYIFDTNVRGTFSCTRAAVPALRETGDGSIINLSSVAGVYARGSSVPYCASKAAVNSMTVSLARALAPQIRVNAVAPGFVDTRWWQDTEHYAAMKELATDATLLKKVCNPEDVSKVIVDLATSTTITGQILVADGGMGIR